MPAGPIPRIAEALSVLWLGLAVLAPVTAAFGLVPASRAIYGMQHLGCSQQPGHSLWVCGHPMGLCARHTAIYGMLGLSVAAPGLSRRLARVHWSMPQLVAACLPMAADGGLEWLHLWSPTTFTRLLTGGLAGAGLGLYLALNTGARPRSAHESPLPPTNYAFEEGQDADAVALRGGVIGD